MKRCEISFDEVISLENLCEAWDEFIRGKRNKKDVQEFQFRLMDHILHLHQELETGTYRHGLYHEFHINDPKPRVIHKALVRDRLLHHAIHRKLYPYFAERFIADSFSCQKGKGVQRALNSIQKKVLRAGRNHHEICWVLKCDIRKFFASLDHFVLADLMEKHLYDQKLLHLMHKVIGSFSSKLGKGIPLGNLTSQLFANIYMNPFDLFVKETLGIKDYVRYADDFVFLSVDHDGLIVILEKVSRFLSEKLALQIHPDKVHLKTIASGVDFLGLVHFSHHRVLRTKTKKRMMKRIAQHPKEEALQSYLGMLEHGDGHQLSKELQNLHWLQQP